MVRAVDGPAAVGAGFNEKDGIFILQPTIVEDAAFVNPRVTPAAGRGVGADRECVEREKESSE
jgi:hypothetical protein